MVWLAFEFAYYNTTVHHINHYATSAFYLVGRVFANDPGDRGSIPSRVIQKTQKWYLMPPCWTLSIIRYRSRVKQSKLRKWAAPSSTPQCSPANFLLMNFRENSKNELLWSLSNFKIYFHSLEETCLMQLLLSGEVPLEKAWISIFSSTPAIGW